MIRVITLFLILLQTFNLFSQENEVDETYKIYQEQLKELYLSRGMSYEEIDSILSLYKTNNISSDKNFANILGRLYPKTNKIAFISYFLIRDSLKIVLFEPGRIKQSKKIKISKEELIALNQDIMNSMKVYELLANRAPRLKNTEIELDNAADISFDAAVKKATETLLPDSFSEKYKHLIIIPAFNIGVFPFHLLRPYQDGSYLIEKCSFTIVPSLLDIVALRSRVVKEASKNKLSFMEINEMLNGWDRDNAYEINEIEEELVAEDSLYIARKNNKLRFKLGFKFNNSLLISNPKYPNDGDYVFPDLPGAKEEIYSAIQTLSNNLDSNSEFKVLPILSSYVNLTFNLDLLNHKNYVLLEGEKASRDTVIKLMNGKDLVYFATHGLASQVNPMEKSCLVLSKPKAYLTAKDIMDLRKDKNFKFPGMVILSACQTGLGKNMEAGVAGLARPFLIGGSNHVVMSLWSVDDKATAYLMSRFIHHLKTPMLHAPSEQLRMAILDTMKKYPNPAHWSSFSIFGIDY